MFFAHSIEGRDCQEWQSLAEHLSAVADLATARGAKFGASKAAALAGLLHDLGKYTEGFAARLRNDTGRVDHSTAGAQEVVRLAEDVDDRLIAQLIAYAIAGHHAGLPDREGDSASLAERLRRPVEPPSPVWRAELAPDARGLVPTDFQFHPCQSRRPFQLAFLGRMLFSCLVDADFRDTEAFYAAAHRMPVDRDWPALGAILDRLIAALADKLRDLRRADTTVNRLRSEILDHVLGRAAAPAGLFTLTVPTGGGKTLASLAFALAHARAHGLDRIVYAIPFTSVIDQTAAVFREALGDGVVLEHHSAIDEERLGGREARNKLRLAMEDWVAPIVVTTNVQLFESLFANRPSRCRKLHNLARSVIVLDEAQTIPLPVLRPCVAALDELARNYSASIVLCTATQPALAAPKFAGGLELGPERELAPNPPRLHAALKRVTVRHAGEMTDEDLLDALSATQGGLVIVNSRSHALSLYRQAVSVGLDGAVHLTTRQYAAHRRAILADVRARLRDGLPCRLIATSLVEAGVDLDFPCVWRAEAGLDQIAQAAGRCNREGRRSPEASVVTVFRSPEHGTPREIAQLAGDMSRAAGRHDDLLSLAAIRDYFGEVYWRKGDALDAGRVIEAFRMSAYETSFDYRAVGERFRLIESALAPVIVARNRPARQAVDRLDRTDTSAGGVARALQPYVVQVPPRARVLLLANGHVRLADERRFGDQFAVLTTDSLYRNETGLLWEDAEYLGLETQII